LPKTGSAPLVYDEAADEVKGSFGMNELYANGEPYSDRYPELIKPRQKFLSTVNGVPGVYIFFPHYRWATGNDHEGNASWYGRWNELYSDNAGNTWYVDGTIYAMFERSGSYTRIMYLLHYPFNAAANRHEGDMPKIVVELDSQNPNEANIVSVQYPYHKVRTIRTSSVTYTPAAAEALHQEVFWDDGNDNPAFAHKYFVIAGTHPVSFGGGRTDEQGIEGWGSHAQYPCPGVWKRKKGIWIASITIEEYVVENGSINNETISIDFNNYQNIKVLPPRQYVISHLISNPEYNWLVFGGWWGDVVSYPSAEEGFLSNVPDFLVDVVETYLVFGIFVDITLVPDVNMAPLSPYGGSLGWEGY
jgi:hypothetical protein